MDPITLLVAGGLGMQAASGLAGAYFGGEAQKEVARIQASTAEKGAGAQHELAMLANKNQKEIMDMLLADRKIERTGNREMAEMQAAVQRWAADLQSKRSLVAGATAGLFSPTGESVPMPPPPPPPGGFPLSSIFG